MPTPPQNTNAQQQEQHVIAAPNPTIDDSKTTATVEPGKLPVTKARPTTGATAAPMKKTVRTKHKRKSRQ